jgi:hypothetical protein
VVGIFVGDEKDGTALGIGVERATQHVVLHSLDISKVLQKPVALKVTQRLVG